MTIPTAFLFLILAAMFFAGALAATALHRFHDTTKTRLDDALVRGMNVTVDELLKAIQKLTKEDIKKPAPSHADEVPVARSRVDIDEPKKKWNSHKSMVASMDDVTDNISDINHPAVV